MRQPTQFPNHFAHPNDKANPKWGLQGARAIWGHAAYSGNMVFYNNSKKHDEEAKFALGLQSTDEYKPLLGVNPEKNKKDYIKAIDWSIKNYATKRVNVAVEKMFQRKYDPILEAIDPTAQDQIAQAKAQMRAQVENREFLQQLGFEQEQGAMEPQNNQELELLLSDPGGFKHYNAMKVELGVQHYITQKRFYDVVKPQYDFYLFVHGAAGIWTEMDENGEPHYFAMHPSRAVLPNMNDPFFQDLPWVGYVEEWDEATLLKKAGAELSETQIEDLAKKHGNQHQRYQYNNSGQTTSNQVNRIPVMRFRIRTTNQSVYIEKPDAAGNPRMYAQDYDTYRKPQEIAKFEKKYQGERKLHRKPYQAVYEGYWVVGSDTVFGYKLMNHQQRPFGNLGESQIGVHIIAPNMYEGKTSSMIRQMIPVLKSLQRHHIKIQHLIAQSLPMGVGIDLQALRAAQLKGPGGKDMTDSELIDMFFQTGIFVFSTLQKDLRGANYKPFLVENIGISNDLERILRLAQQDLFDLDDIIGMNPATVGSALDPKQGKAVTEYQLSQSDVAMGHLFRADAYLVERLFESLAILYVQSVKYHKREKTGYYERIFGEASTTQLVHADTDITQHHYGIQAEARPTAQEWQELYAQAQDLVGKQVLRYSDVMLLKEMTNLKQARLYFMMLENRRMQEQAEAEQRSVQLTGEVQKASNEQTHGNNISLEELKAKAAIQLERERQNTVRLEMELEKRRHEAVAKIQRQARLEEEQIQGENAKEQIRLKAQLEPKTPKPATAK